MVRTMVLIVNGRSHVEGPVSVRQWSEDESRVAETSQ